MKEWHTDESVALRPVPLDGLLSTTTPAPAYAVEALVPRGVVTLLSGHGGAGKSQLALSMAAHVAAGAFKWADHRIDDGGALFVSLEDSGAVVRYRLRKIVEHFGLDANKVERRLLIVDGTEGDGSLAGEVNDMGTRRLALSRAYIELEELARDRKLVIIDNASDGFDANENDRRLVRAFVRSLAAVARNNDAGMVLLAHVDKHAARNGSAGNTFSGSTGWHNSARSRLALVKNDTGEVELIHEKANFGPLAEPIRFHWSEHGVLVPLDRATGAPGAHADADAVLAALRAAHAAGVDVGAGRTGTGNARLVLETFDELPPHLRGSRGNRAFWYAMGKLHADGSVRREEVVTGQRKRKAVLVPAACASYEHIEYARSSSPTPPAPKGAHGVRGLCASSAPIEPAQTGAASDDDFAERIMARFEREAVR